MKDFQIVIPTHARPYRQTTLKSIPPEIRDEVLLVTSTEEDSEILSKTHRNTIRAIHSGGIAAKRQWIMQNVKARKIFMLDDDMYFFGRCPREARDYIGGRWKAQPGHKVLSRDYAPDDAVVLMFGILSHMLDNYAHVGLSSRMGNDVVQPEVVEVGRVMHAIGFHSEVFRKQRVDFSTVRFREDFHAALSLLRAGFKNAILYAYCCSPGAYGAVGGTSTERTREDSDREAERLAALHPGFVRVVEKNYDNEPRKEVVVSWRRAYNTTGE